jgi:hypothetical protein
VARWISTALVGAASSFVVPFVATTSARIGLSLVAAAALIVLAYWGAKAEIREQENHIRILELSEQIVATAQTAQDAHAQAYRPVAERRAQEDYELIVKPMDDAAKRLWNAVKSFVTGVPSPPNEAE